MHFTPVDTWPGKEMDVPIQLLLSKFPELKLVEDGRRVSIITLCKNAVVCSLERVIA